jgi:hypothetical protein
VSNKNWDEKDAMLKCAAADKARAILIEAGFDAAIILASWTAEDGSTSVRITKYGNYYASTGMLVEELQRRRDEAHEGSVITTDDDDGQD